MLFLYSTYIPQEQPINNACLDAEQAFIISHNGASGVYAGSTDLAYQQAVEDGANIIDCSVQMSKDGVAFCLDSVDVTRDTTAAASFMSLSTTIPEIQESAGIFSFDLSWSDIQTLQRKLCCYFPAYNFVQAIF
jgi:glycerophosphoryl diester phosphodiesterase